MSRPGMGWFGSAIMFIVRRYSFHITIVIGSPLVCWGFKSKLPMENGRQFQECLSCCLGIRMTVPWRHLRQLPINPAETVLVLFQWFFFWLLDPPWIIQPLNHSLESTHSLRIISDQPTIDRILIYYHFLSFSFSPKKIKSQQLPTVWPLRCTTTSSVVRCLPWATTSSVVGWNSPQKLGQLGCFMLTEVGAGLVWLRPLDNDGICRNWWPNHKLWGYQVPLVWWTFFGENEDWPVDGWSIFTFILGERMGKKTCGVSPTQSFFVRMICFVPLDPATGA